jgi:peptidoglycan/xylan/chitin deacetylase (PgdA/CDA1 family)
MRLSRFLFFAMFVVALSLHAQTRTVAITVDDLPFVFVGGHGADADRMALTANRKLVKALVRHHVPVTGFVIEKSVEELGTNVGAKILRDWTQSGLDLGNHSYAHPDFNDLTVEQMEDQIVRGEATFAPLMKAASRKVEFFRFPFNHTGDTKEKHDAVAAFLAQRGYRLAPCTIETEDWMFNDAYHRMLKRRDNASAARLRKDYLAFTAAQIDYFSGLHRQIFGYEPPHVMLIHDNALNADVIEELLAIFEAKQYRFVSLAQAESDAAYRTPETEITKYGPMWGYRWARELNVKVDGSLEPEPPKWVTEYGQKTPPKPRRVRAAFLHSSSTLESGDHRQSQRSQPSSVGKDEDHSGDDQVGALDLCAAVCVDRRAAGGEWPSALANAGLDSGLHGLGALGGHGLQSLGRCRA